MWYRVLVARYGEDDGNINDGGSTTSTWWRNLLSIKEGVGEGDGSWFDDDIQREVGDGVGTLFCWDAWLEGGTLESRYCLLFYLSINKTVNVSDMYLLGWGGR